MERADSQPPREPLLAVLIEATKRAHTVLDSTQRLSAKLYGPIPTENGLAEMQDISAAGLAHQLVRVLAEIEVELDRQHNGLGDHTPKSAMMGASSQQSARAVNY
jgi:hypothetical protein